MIEIMNLKSYIYTHRNYYIQTIKNTITVIRYGIKL